MIMLECGGVRVLSMLMSADYEFAFYASVCLTCSMQDIHLLFILSSGCSS